MAVSFPDAQPPCPFCGNDDRRLMELIGYNKKGEKVFLCNVCGKASYPTSIGPSLENA